MPAPPPPAAIPPAEALPEAAGRPAPVPATPPEGAVPFADWGKVLARLATANPPLAGALVGSTAYQKGDMMQIDAKNEMFFRLIRQDDLAKSSLRGAIHDVTGSWFRLGPYAPSQPAQAPAQADPMDAVLAAARAADIPIRP